MPAGVSVATGLSILACHFCKFSEQSTLSVQLFAQNLCAAFSRTIPGFVPPSAPAKAIAGEPAKTFQALVLDPLAECKAPPLKDAAVHCILIDSLDESLVVSRNQVIWSRLPLCAHFVLSQISIAAFLAI